MINLKNKLKKALPMPVFIEVENLKKHATEEEKGRLDFDSFDVRLSSNCIYGQMTNDCFSNRAFELIQKCAVKFYYSIKFEFEAKTTMLSKDARHFTALENYIYIFPENNELIIQYIKE